jgi:Smg protein
VVTAAGALVRRACRTEARVRRLPQCRGDCLRAVRNMKDPMNDNVLDILIYLFENYLDSDDVPQPSRDLLREELEHAGYAESGIERALEWLEGLAGGATPVVGDVNLRSFRVFNDYEQARLTPDVRGYLVQLEAIGILSAQQRELVIDRLLALEAEEIDIEQVKWVVLMVLFSQPGQEQAYQRMEDLVFDGQSDALH